MPNWHSRRILQHLADQRYQPRTIRDLAQDLNIPGDQFDDFRQAAEQLLTEGLILRGAAETIALPPPGKEMIGVFRKHERGFGFLVPDDPTEHGDLFVPEHHTADALTGDRVRARVLHQKGRAGGGRSPYIGRILEVLERADRQYAGTLTRRGSAWVVQVDGRALHEPVRIRDPHAKNAKDGDKVVIELIEFGKRGDAIEGVITEVLGEGGEPEVETLAVMRAYGLVEQFPPNVTQAARDAASNFSDDAVPADREDLTHHLIATIDPPDAKDYDDAISIRKRGDELAESDAFGPPVDWQPDAMYELGVHIADVSHFVKPGSPLDLEAYERGNSTYLPRRVIPMLPELLSNGVCSLQEGVNRFAKTVFIQFDAKGRPLVSRFARSVIHSAKRLTYIEAQALIDGDLRTARKHTKSEPKYPRPLIHALKLMDELAKTIRQRRMDDGMIVLGLPEVELVFDDSGRVTDAEPEDTSFTHTLIEMFMVEANEAAARLFDGLDVPMIRRVHPDPDAYDITELRSFARVAGYNIPSRPSRKELQALLESVRDKPAQHAVHLAVLKTLSKAEYSPAPIGHFALASDHYTHYTSPIRRYPDLIVHRGIDAFIKASEQAKRKKQVAANVRGDARVPNEDQLRELGRHCSTTERNSESAERELRNYLVMELLADRLGDDFAGTVTGVTSAGVFIELDQFLVDGFIRAADLPGRGERWKHNRNTGALVAEGSGRTITIGDRFTVRVARVDLARRQMDLVVVEEPGKPGKPKRKQPAGAKKAAAATTRIKKVVERDRRKGKLSGKQGDDRKSGKKKKGKRTMPKHLKKKKRRGN